MSGIFDEMVSVENVFAAWREFRRGKRDKPDAQEFERRLEDNVFGLAEDLRSGRYRHGPYRRFLVCDPKLRVIHKATVRDRLVHHAVHRVLAPLLERSFIHDSYSCRVGKGTHAAVRRLEDFARRVSGNYRYSCFALKLDVRRFFDSVDHGILLGCLERQVDCPRTLNLLSEIIGSFSCDQPVGGGGGSLTDSRPATGLPLGNLTSQLFANLYLDAFDHFIKENLRARCYVRYTDDAVILHRDAGYLKGLVGPIAGWLASERHLSLHPHKLEIRKLGQGVDFLGYVTLPHHRVLRTKTKRRLLRRASSENSASYLGVLRQCNGYALRQALVWRVGCRR